MTDRRATPVRCLAMVLCALAGCAPDRSAPDPLSARFSTTGTGPRLDAVTPAVAMRATGAEVTLSGSGFGAGVAAVTLVQPRDDGTEDVVVATGVQRRSGSVITATFPPVASQQVGWRTVVVHFTSGRRATLANGFLYRYEQDPIVFVHGCPLPKGLGSETNYITSKYWHPLYNALRGPDGSGYPAPQWTARDEFETNDDHPAARPAMKNFLNVFALSEDWRLRGHEEDHHSNPSRGGHCGSGLKLAEELDSYVDRVLALTGADRIDLVVNSGGAPGARWYLRHYQGTAKVREVVFLAALNHGTEVAVAPATDTVTGTWRTPNYDTAREAYPGYACEGAAVATNQFTDRHGHTLRGSDLQWLVSGCLDPVRHDHFSEVPADVRTQTDPADGVSYLNVYNTLVDELIEPTHSACLNQRFRGDCTDEINVPVHAVDPSNPRETPHGAIRADPEVLALTICHLRTRGPKHLELDRRCEAERLAATTR